MIIGNICIGLHVESTVGLLNNPMLHRARRFYPWHTAVSFDRSGERASFAAHERACALVDLEVERKPAVPECRRPKAQTCALPQSPPCSLLPRADIPHARNISFSARPCGDSRDHHSFDHTMRIALHNAAVHKRARISLVAVAHHITLRLPSGGLPAAAFSLPWGTAAATAPQAAVGHLLYDFLRLHFKQRLLQQPDSRRAQYIPRLILYPYARS